MNIRKQIRELGDLIKDPTERKALGNEAAPAHGAERCYSTGDMPPGLLLRIAQDEESEEYGDKHPHKKLTYAAVNPEEMAAISRLTCTRCGYQWWQRVRADGTPHVPKTCPAVDCHSPYWNKPRTKVFKQGPCALFMNKLPSKLTKLATQIVKNSK